MYWNAQNESEHTTPDWKLHVSCSLCDIGRAWNSIAALFMDMKCEIGMKATVLDSTQWSDAQRGREITIYVYRYHYSYEGYMQGVVPGLDHDLYLGREWDVIYNTPFWFTFITEVERRLIQLGVGNRGVAVGDLALPGCQYVSLRNEAFVRVPEAIQSPSTRPAAQDDESKIHNDEMKSSLHQTEDGSLAPVSSEALPPHPLPLIYPPNYSGWNAAKHPNVFLELIFFFRAFQNFKSQLVI